MMIAETLVIEERDVKDFHRVKLTGYGEVHIEQGDEEHLTIESDRGKLQVIMSEVVMGRLELGQGRRLMDKLNLAFETSLTRVPIRYRLTVKQLNELEIGGAYKVYVQGISTGTLLLKVNGANDVHFDSLAAELLTVDVSVGGVIDLDGFVDEQLVSIKGPTSYRASTLKSKRAKVTVTGPSTAIVKVSDELDVVIRGLGSVKYLGNPKLQKKLSGLGSISKMD
jgi:hypothetical protein